jgi:hypothetical protein
MDADTSKPITARDIALASAYVLGALLLTAGSLITGERAYVAHWLNS